MDLVFALGYFSVLAGVFLSKLWPVWSTCIPGGLEDTRLFLWNAWWFHYAISVLHTNPFTTSMLFHPFGARLVSHDFPLWTNLITFLGQTQGLTMVAASNVWFILSWVLLGFCVYGLAREVTGKPAAALAAGTLAMTHSYSLARAMQNWGQFNSYAIALFLWAFVRARRRGTAGSFALAGAALAWTAACHYYFLMYCVVMVLAVAAYDLFPKRVSFSHRQGSGSAGQKSLLAVAVAAGVLAGFIILHPMMLHWNGMSIGLHGPENVLFVMWMSLAAWAASYWHVAFLPRPLDPAWRHERLKHYFILVGISALLLSPLFWETLKLLREGGYPKQSILWKTHPEGANLFALFSPNPIHAVWGPAVSAWFSRHLMNPQEQAASIGWACLAIVMTSRLWKADTRARGWLALALSATVLAMGTHLHVLQYNFWCPLPFFFFRLLPVLGNVRVPERWMSVGAIAWSVVLALALIRLAEKRGWSLRRLSMITIALVLVENWPGIPILPTAPVSPVYTRLRQLPDGAVLPIPLYIGDSSIGAGNAIENGFLFPWDHLWAQITHQKPMLGGYIGRIARRIIDQYKADTFVNHLLALEEGRTKDATPNPEAGRAAVQTLSFRYVLIYPGCMEARTLAYTLGSLPLEPLEVSGPVQLYEVKAGRSG